MMRRLTRMSLILLVLLIGYWIVADRYGKDFSRLDSDDRHPIASFVIGKTEFAWLVDRRSVLVPIVSDSTGKSLPVIGGHGLISALFDGRLKWSAEPSIRWFYVFGVTTFAGTGEDGGVVSIRIVHSRYYWPVALFAVLPIIRLFGATWRRSRRMLRTRRVASVRRKRNGLGRCACGYDLRQSRNRCPECGRAIRWVPVSIPSLK